MCASNSHVPHPHPTPCSCPFHKSTAYPTLPCCTPQGPPHRHKSFTRPHGPRTAGSRPTLHGSTLSVVFRRVAWFALRLGFPQPIAHSYSPQATAHPTPATNPLSWPCPVWFARLVPGCPGPVPGEPRTTYGSRAEEPTPARAERHRASSGKPASTPQESAGAQDAAQRVRARGAGAFCTGMPSHHLGF